MIVDVGLLQVVAAAVVMIVRVSFFMVNCLWSAGMWLFIFVCSGQQNCGRCFFFLFSFFFVRFVSNFRGIATDKIGGRAIAFGSKYGKTTYYA